MSSPEDKQRKRTRMERKKREKMQSPIAKDLRTPKYRKRVIKDKRGKKYDLKTMSHYDFVQAIQEEDFNEN